MFDFTVRIASFPPPTPAEQTMFAAIAERPEETSQLLGAIAGSVPITSLFSPRRLISLTGLRGFAGPGAKPTAAGDPAPRLRSRSSQIASHDHRGPTRSRQVSAPYPRKSLRDFAGTPGR
jgi:hypothetical protein